jgi:hypothetical protein
MKTKLIFTINGCIHLLIGTFLWVQAVIVGAFNIGIRLMLVSIRNLVDLESARKVLRGHTLLCACGLLLSALFNTIFLEGGPPLPVFILLILAVNLAAYGSKKGTI